MNKEHPDLLKKIAEKKAIDGDLDKNIASALKDFNLRFKKDVE
jgi:hypothetical protein